MKEKNTHKHTHTHPIHITSQLSISIMNGSAKLIAPFVVVGGRNRLSDPYGGIKIKTLTIIIIDVECLMNVFINSHLSVFITPQLERRSGSDEIERGATLRRPEQWRKAARVVRCWSCGHQTGRRSFPCA